MASRQKPDEHIYLGLVQDLSGLLEQARRASARAVNTVMTATYWEIGRRIVEFEQGGAERAEYGTQLLVRLGQDLNRRFGRGFSRPNIQRFRDFYLEFRQPEIRSTPSSESSESASAPCFPLPWSHYVLLLSRSRSPEALATTTPRPCAAERLSRQIPRCGPRSSWSGIRATIHRLDILELPL